MTLGGATAQVRLTVWCKECQHQIEPDPAEMAARYGARRPHRVTDLAGGLSRRVTADPRTQMAVPTQLIELLPLCGHALL